MRFPFLLAFLALSCASTAQLPQQAAPPPTQQILISNARVWGHDGATTVLIDNGRIAAIGSDFKPSRSDALQIDAQGGLVLHGFRDAHIHLLSGGLSSLRVVISDTLKMDAILAEVKRWAAEHPDHPWVLGRGWSYDIVPKGQFPTRQQLDSAVADRPVLLTSYDGHTVWANTAALKAGAIGPDTKNPDGGTVVREKDGRTPQGALLENAIDLIWEHIPKPTPEQQSAGLESALAHCAALGITHVVAIESGPHVAERLAELQRDHRLPLYVDFALPLDSDATTIAATRDLLQGKLRLTHLKGFVDGVIESRTAYMLAAYTNGSDHGESMLDSTTLDNGIKAAHAAGLGVELHAIGDAAVRLSLDAFEKAGRSAGPPDSVEHIEVLHPDDARRFAQLGVIASMQPYHSVPSATPDQGVWSQNLGAERLKHSFPWQELRAAGATLAFGSDWPVMSANPLWGLAVAISRRNSDSLPEQGWNAHQAVPIDTALAAYHSGPIRTDAPANVVILSPDVRFEDARTLWNGQVVATIVDGTVIYRR